MLICLKKLIGKRLQVLILTWNEKRYISGVDANGESIRQKQAKTQQRQDAQAGIHSFSPTKLTESLRSGLFPYYCVMAQSVESVPTALAQESEFCICNGPLIANLTEYERRLMFKEHYGDEGACPLGGRVVLKSWAAV